MFANISSFLKEFVSPRQMSQRVTTKPVQPVQVLRPLGFNEFLNLDIAPREMLLNPILPERSLGMLYAPRGVGKSWLSLSIGLAVASGSGFLRWSAPGKRRVLYVDGEMP